MSLLKFGVFLISFLLIAQVFQMYNAYSEGPEYPVIFIHGINDSDKCWNSWDKNSGKLRSLGWSNGIPAGVKDTMAKLRIDVCLDMKHNSISESNVDDDVAIFNPATKTFSKTSFNIKLPKSDYYYINFNIDSNGNRYEGSFIPSLYILSSAGSLSTIYVLSSSDETMLVRKDSKLQVNDIIRIDDEIMYIKRIEPVSRGLQLTLTRGCEGTKSDIHSVSGIYVITNESNQAAITKQGKGIELAIDAVKKATNAKKVILVAHSMGGLASREYLQNRYGNRGDVDRLITIGTPHLGSCSGDALPEAISTLFTGIDERSDAVRDLRYTFEKTKTKTPSDSDDAVYLFGGNESKVPALLGEKPIKKEYSYYTADVNCNGIIGDTDIEGLNNRDLPSDVGYRWIVGKAFNSDPEGDGVVRADRQYLSSAGVVEVIEAVHVPSLKLLKLNKFPAETECFDKILRAITLERKNVELAQQESTQLEGVSELPKKIVGKDGAPMVLIPAGEFQMGSDDGEIDQRPLHKVYLDAFYMDKYEVTNAQYKKFVKATGHKEPQGEFDMNGNWVSGKLWSNRNYNGDDQPVVCVTWNDAKAYAKWAGKRLPTEAEWEKAARGGLVGKKYPWGDTLTHDNANYDGTGRKDIWNGPSPVGSFAPNGYGLYDMTGNVSEMCADWYVYDYYGNSPKSNPLGPDWESPAGPSPVSRGGSCFTNAASDLSVAYREHWGGNIITWDINDVICSLGFRCVQ